MPQLAFYMVDAFTPRLFGGNPAAVCPLSAWLPDSTLQNLTNEHNQSETAFFVPTPEGYELRWFTVSTGEIDLCGHATLASAHVIFHHLNHPTSTIRFSTRFVGGLEVQRDGAWLTLDFPAWPPEPVAVLPPETRAGLLGAAPQACFVKRDYLFVYADEDAVRNLEPDFKNIAKLGRRVCVTAPGKDCDFVSRFFCPGEPLEEDPVTGSAHSMLIPYWAERLGKTRFNARQLSKRGGELRCEYKGDRVLIAGQAQTYMQGKIFLPD